MPAVRRGSGSTKPICSPCSGPWGDPLACPLLADLRGLPPAFMAIADRDLLLEENLLMASRLAQAGVRVRPVVYPGTAHSFLETVSVAA